ncbi:netrin receptor UNC5B-a-like [Strongylocentrotus purpuratus]|uniref:ZU5 domain-containing protein n=1 Tax=Strongylocentrotus purpuratus TaxID=7668 RepID=A0A7M7P2B0_STRPU|nr:netrin receptor UNC5B-a-like [Strongylocentrotus purpuratus]
MLSSWIASHTSGSIAKQTLKSDGESVEDVSKSEKTKDGAKGIALLNTETAGTSQALPDESYQGTTEAKKNDFDNLLEKAQFGSDSVEPIDHALDGSSATGKFGALGGKLSTKCHGFVLHIPPDALEKDEEISLRVLTEIPNSLTLKKDELLASHGFQCYPSGLRFKKPAMLIIPHCALVSAHNNVKTVLYFWNQSGN